MRKSAKSEVKSEAKSVPLELVREICKSVDLDPAKVLLMRCTPDEMEFTLISDPIEVHFDERGTPRIITKNVVVAISGRL